MASVSVQARINSELWEALKQPGETNTQLLQRIAAHYQATSGGKLAEIAPTPDAAVAVLLHSHRLLSQFAGGNTISQPAAAEQPPEQYQPQQLAAECADDW